MTSPDLNFPAECAHLYPEGFRYPEGYFPPRGRVTDPAVLEKFDELSRPYLVVAESGAMEADPNASVAFKHLIHPGDTSLTTALRYIQWNGPPDLALAATFDCEDALTTAGHYSEAGFHHKAIALIRSLPQPFQESVPALRALVHSLSALERHEEALQHLRRLIPAEKGNDPMIQLHRIKEADLLILCGHAGEAQQLLDQYRVELSQHYTYYGARAALALKRNDEALARNLILEAGRVNAFHAHKLLWNPSLRPLASYIRNELLDESLKPLPYRQDREVRRICEQLQAAILMAEMERAQDLGEGLLLRNISDFSTAQEAVLCFIGLGQFEHLESALRFLPGWRTHEFQLSHALTQVVLDGRPSTVVQALEAFDKADANVERKQLFSTLLKWALTKKKPDFPPDQEEVVVQAEGIWTDAGRAECFLIRTSAGEWIIKEYFVGRILNRKPEETERKAGLSHDDALQWLEGRLQFNTHLIKNKGWHSRDWDFNWNGWKALRVLSPDAAKTPLVSEIWSNLRINPNVAHGPPANYAFDPGFAWRFLEILRIYLNRQR